ncbi:MAG: SIS domain-containing protein [Anaerolineae bacterium]|nr:SIS domain-containing protein [Anaerolineae bacterium]
MSRWFDKLITKYPELHACLPQVEEAYRLIKTCYEQDGTLLLCGNGGSAADCEHVVGELMKGYLQKRPVPADVRAALQAQDAASADTLADHLQGALRAISLVSQTALLTAYANDVAADMIFAQQVYGYGRPGDVLIGISTSGNSRNILNALRVAQARGVKTVGVTGQSGGQMKDLCDVAICVPWTDTTDIQERHLAIYHALCAQIEEDFFG